MEEQDKTKMRIETNIRRWELVYRAVAVKLAEAIQAKHMPDIMDLMLVLKHAQDRSNAVAQALMDLGPPNALEARYEAFGEAVSDLEFTQAKRLIKDYQVRLEERRRGRLKKRLAPR